MWRVQVWSGCPPEREVWTWPLTAAFLACLCSTAAPGRSPCRIPCVIAGHLGMIRL